MNPPRAGVVRAAAAMAAPASTVRAMDRFPVCGVHERKRRIVRLLKKAHALPGSETRMRVSIVITSYNLGRFLRDAIQSALDVRWSDKEVIVCDDGSTD